MSSKKTKSSGMPLAIIVIVFIGAFIGACFLYNSSKSGPNSNSARGNSQNRPGQPAQPANAPLGAQPPNMLGSATATVTIEEFADFQCGSCAAAHPVMKEIQQIYQNRIRFIFRNYPLQIPAHDKAYDAAVAAEAAGMQGSTKFWAMQDLLFTNQSAWSQNPNYRELWAEYAGRIGLDIERWKTDMAGLAAKSRVDQDLARGRGLKVDSTPTIYVNGRSIPFPDVNVQTMRQIVDAELQSAQPANSGAAPANATSGAK
jgi:protein-disulfide isomerase